MMRSFIFLSLLSLLGHDLSAGFNGPAKPVDVNDRFNEVRGRGAVQHQQQSHDMEIEPSQSSEAQTTPLPEKKFQHEIEFYREIAHRAGELPQDYCYASSSSDSFASLEFEGILGCPVPFPDLTRMSLSQMTKYFHEFLMPVGNIGRKLMLMGRANPNLANSLLADLHAFYGARLHSILDNPQEIHGFVMSLRKWALYLDRFQVADSQVIEPVIPPLWRLPEYRSLFTSQKLFFSDQLKLMNVSTSQALNEALQVVTSPKELRTMTDAMQGLSLQGEKRGAESQGSPLSPKRKPRGKKLARRL